MPRASWMLAGVLAIACCPLPRTEVATPAPAAIHEVAAPPAPPLAAPTSPPTTLLVSIDGLMPSQVVGADALGLKVPNLRRLAEEGTFATGVRGVVPTLTYPSHTTMLTGTSPAHHGVLMNTPFDPLGLNRGGWSW